MRVVCFGMSAGGLQPLARVIKGLGANTGMAFVVIAHMSRTGPSHLPELLSCWSTMPVSEARTGLVLQPDHIYVIPPGQEMMLEGGSFRVQPRSPRRGFSNVITLFLDSMAKEPVAKQGQAPGIAVILSGLDGDGSAALRELTDRGGIAIAQEPSSADQPGMPDSAIATGCVDYVLPPGEIAPCLERLARNTGVDARAAISPLAVPPASPGNSSPADPDAPGIQPDR